jgi:hypothetical protein
MNITVEVWPVAADEAGIWLVSGNDALRWGPVPSDGDVHYEAESLLAEQGISPAADVAAIHSTSWRPDGPTIVLTYMAVIKVTGFAMERWPDAAPVTADLAEAVGKPPTHAANEAPVPRYIDVLWHGLRHLAYLRDHDEEADAAMGELWQHHLEPLRPALAGLYSERHVA